MYKSILLLVLLICLTGILLAQEKNEPKKENLEPRYEKREGFVVVGIEAVDAMEGDKMMELWTKFAEISPKIPDAVSPVEYGITYYGKDYDPETMKGYNYFVGKEVSSVDNIPEGLLMHKVPEGHYAVFEHKGLIQNIGKTYGYIFGAWMQGNGIKAAQQDVFEVYDKRFKYDSEDSILEIWVPIEK